MAQSRKQQQAAKRERMNAAVNHAVVEVTPAAIPEPPVVAPAPAVPTPPRIKPAKKRHVRPQRGATTAGIAPLVRGSTHSAKSMSARVAKSLGGAVASGSDGGTPLGRIKMRLLNRPPRNRHHPDRIGGWPGGEPAIHKIRLPRCPRNYFPPSPSLLFGARRRRSPDRCIR